MIQFSMIHLQSLLLSILCPHTHHIHTHHIHTYMHPHTFYQKCSFKNYMKPLEKEKFHLNCTDFTSLSKDHLSEHLSADPLSKINRCLLIFTKRMPTLFSTEPFSPLFTASEKKRHLFQDSDSLIVNIFITRPFI